MREIRKKCNFPAIIDNLRSQTSKEKRATEVIDAGIATKIEYTKKKNSELDDQELGAYLIKTNLNTEDELSLWTIYNSMREIESTFRCLKNGP